MPRGTGSSDEDYMNVSGSSSSGSSSDSDSGDDFAELVRSFVGEVARWCKTNAAKIIGAYDSQVGYESWLEVELYLWLTEKAPRMEVSRQPHYLVKGVERQRGDLLIGGDVTIELKVETATEEVKDFADRVDADTGKVDKGQGVRGAVVVAFARSTAAISELEKMMPGGIDGGAVNIFHEATRG